MPTRTKKNPELTVDERIDVLQRELTDHTLKQYVDLHNAATITFPEGQRPNLVQYASLVGIVGMYRAESKWAEKSYLRRMMALQTVVMTERTQRGLKTDKLWDEVEKIAAREISATENLSETLDSWPPAWKKAMNGLLGLTEAVSIKRVTS